MSSHSGAAQRGRRPLARFFAYHLSSQMLFLSGVWVLYLQHRGFSLAEIGIAEAGFHLAPVLLELPSGAFADLVGRRWALATSAALAATGTILLWNAGTLTVAVLALFVEGASFSFRSGANQAYLYDALPEEARSGFGRLFGRLLSAGYLIGGLATWIGATLSERSYAIPLALSLSVAIAGVWLALGLPEPPRKDAGVAIRTPRGHVTEIRAVLRAQPAVAAMLLVAAGYWTMLTISGIYAQAAFAERGLDNGAIGLIMGLTAVAIAAGTFAGGQLRDGEGRFARRWVVLTLLTGIGTATVGVRWTALAVGAFIAADFVSGIVETQLAAWYNAQLPSAQRATILSIESWLFSCSMIVLFPLAGVLAERSGWAALYATCGALGGTTALAGLLLRRHDRAGRAAAPAARPAGGPEPGERGPGGTAARPGADDVTSIRIATLNLWNADRQRVERLHAAAEALTDLDAGIVALQEVDMRLTALGEGTDAAHWLAERAGYAHVLVHRYTDAPDEGLAFLARARLQQHHLPGDIDIALRVETTIGDVSLAITNVHLDWRSVLTRERQVVDIVSAIGRESSGERYEILLGDFNNYPESSVYQFLAGQQTLLGHETVPWHDLARSWAARAGSKPAPTLDFQRNPRWQDAPALDRPARCDWILARDTFEAGLTPPSLTDAGIFGDEPAPIARVVTSDHYGVFADLAFP